MTILEMLAQRHAKDVFVPECKDGPTWRGEHLRLDAWAMSRSWSHLCFYGYEIKRSRADFLRDQKWHAYLPLCNEFWFVTSQPGVIDPSELPPECGLLVAASTGTRLLTKKAAPRRQVEPPLILLCYVLMCRADIKARAFLQQEEPANLDYWKSWLSNKEESREIGRRVGQALRQRYNKEVLDVQTKNRLLESENAKAREIMRVAKELGVDQWWGAQDLQRKIQTLKAPAPPVTPERLQQLDDALRTLQALRGDLRGDLRR